MISRLTAPFVEHMSKLQATCTSLTASLKFEGSREGEDGCFTCMSSTGAAISSPPIWLQVTSGMEESTTGSSGELSNLITLGLFLLARFLGVRVFGAILVEQRKASSSCVRSCICASRVFSRPPAICLYHASVQVHWRCNLQHEISLAASGIDSAAGAPHSYPWAVPGPSAYHSSGSLELT